MADECIFCKIGRGQTETALLYRDAYVFVIRDIRPKAPTHLLIIPFQHLTSLAYVTPGSEPAMGHLFTVAEEMARREGITLSGYRLVVNQGPDSGQELPHFHMHVLGGKRLTSMA